MFISAVLFIVIVAFCAVGVYTFLLPVLGMTGAWLAGAFIAVAIFFVVTR